MEQGEKIPVEMEGQRLYSNYNAYQLPVQSGDYILGYQRKG